MIIVTLLMCLLLFVCICFGIGQVVWIYLDAKERGDRLKVVWALLRYFLFLCLIYYHYHLLFIYLLVVAMRLHVQLVMKKLDQIMSLAHVVVNT